MWYLWTWNEGFWNKLLVQMTLIVHLLISFFEPASLAELQESGSPRYCIRVEIICILIEPQDAISKTIITYQALPVRNKIVENFKTRIVVSLLLDLVLLWILFDVIIASTVRFSIQFFIPWKIFIILLELKEVRYVFFLIYFVLIISDSRKICMHSFQPSVLQRTYLYYTSQF